MSGVCRLYMRRYVVFLMLLVVALGFGFNQPSQARAKSAVVKRSSHAPSASKSSASRSSSSSSRSASSRGKKSSGKRGRHEEVAHGKHGKHGKHHDKHHKVHHHHHHVVHKPRYAYPIEMFMMKAPEFDASPLDEDQAYDVKSAFARGMADKYPARTLVRAGVVKHHPLRGGIYWRREPIKYIIMHSTETGVPVSAVRVIESWSSMGRRHPGAQYVVERDGTIYQAVDPDLATVHINILKTLPGINNDNSIGIEMNHTGSQDYPDAQLQSVIRLVTYLQDRYQIQSENIITHRYAQQGDHTDPVRFEWKGFLASKDRHRNEAIAYKMKNMEKDAGTWGDYAQPPAVVEGQPQTILQPHTTVLPQLPDQKKNAPSAPPSKQTVIQGVPFTPPPGQPKGETTGGTPASPAPTTIVVPADGGLPVKQPGERMIETKPVENQPPAIVPPSPSTPSARPSTTSPAAPHLPPLRGPIEVGPEHADELSAPR